MSLREIKFQYQPNQPSKNKLKEKREQNIKIKTGNFFKRKFKTMGQHYAKSTFSFASTDLYNFILHITQPHFFIINYYI